MFFRPKKQDVILPDTKMIFLTARGNPQQKNEYFLNNTKLHDAVLTNNDKEVKKLLLDEKESKNINEASLMNTPLLLALKQGNTDIAKCILTIAKESDLELNINHKDGRGLTALEWACMLRDKQVITLILTHPDLILSKDSYAKALYYQSVDENIFAHFLEDMAKSNAREIAENRGFAHLFMFAQEPYSDMIYFMKDICVNRGVMQEKDFPPIEGASHVWFYRCFKLGYQPFCTTRNKIPVDNELLTAMLTQESLAEWREKMATSPGDTDTLAYEVSVISLDNDTSIVINKLQRQN